MLFKLIFMEWPLVFFTLFVQGALGLSLFYTVFSYTDSSLKEEGNFKKYTAVFGLTVFLGLFSAVLHLSNPFNGYNILFRIFYEVNEKIYIGWLPLEVIALGFTSLLAGVIFYLKFKGIKEDLTQKGILLLPLMAFIGLLFMVGIYSSKSSTVLVWDFKYTFLMFFTSSLVLGPLFFLALFKQISKKTKQQVIMALTVGKVLFLTVQLFYVLHLASVFILGIGSAFDLAYGYYVPLLFTGVVSIVVSLLVLLYFTIIKQELSVKYIYGSFALTFFGMVCIRILFYGINNVHMFL